MDSFKEYLTSPGTVHAIRMERGHKGDVKSGLIENDT